MARRFVLAVTGASGAVYALRLLRILLQSECHVHLVASASGRTVLAQEVGLRMTPDRFDSDEWLAPLAAWPIAEELRNSLASAFPETPDVLESLASRVIFHGEGDFLTPIASGSFLTDGMIICPCSGSTLSGISHGSSNNLIQRAADVHLKEHRRLVLVPRETPLSSIQLENMHRCAQAGAVVLPAMPGWYHGACNLADMVDFVVGRICDQLGVGVELIRRWG